MAQTPSGHTVLYGRSAKENDELCRNAMENDIWFHVSGFPGSHCLILIQNDSPPVLKCDLQFVASLAKLRSKAKLLPKVSVDYCPFKNVYIDWDNRKRHAGEVMIRQSRALWV